MHENKIDGVIFDVSSCKTIQAQNFEQEWILVFHKVWMKFLCLLCANNTLLCLYRLENETVVKGSKEKLSTFSSISVRFLFDLRKIASYIKRLKKIESIFSEKPAVILWSVNAHLKTQGFQSSWMLPVEMALPISNPSSNIIFGYCFIDKEWIFSLEMKRSELAWVPAWVFNVVHHDCLDEW